MQTDFQRFYMFRHVTAQSARARRVRLSQQGTYSPACLFVSLQRSARAEDTPCSGLWSAETTQTRLYSTFQGLMRIIPLPHSLHSVLSILGYIHSFFPIGLKCFFPPLPSTDKPLPFFPPSLGVAVLGWGWCPCSGIALWLTPSVFTWQETSVPSLEGHCFFQVPPWNTQSFSVQLYN